MPGRRWLDRIFYSYQAIAQPPNFERHTEKSLLKAEVALQLRVERRQERERDPALSDPFLLKQNVLSE